MSVPEPRFPTRKSRPHETETVTRNEKKKNNGLISTAWPKNPGECCGSIRDSQITRFPSHGMFNGEASDSPAAAGRAHFGNKVQTANKGLQRAHMHVRLAC